MRTSAEILPPSPQGKPPRTPHLLDRDLLAGSLRGGQRSLPSGALLRDRRRFHRWPQQGSCSGDRYRLQWCICGHTHSLLSSPPLTPALSPLRVAPIPSGCPQSPFSHPQTPSGLP